MSDDILDFMDEKPDEVKEEVNDSEVEKTSNSKSTGGFNKDDFEPNWDAVFEPLTIDPATLKRGVGEYTAIGNPDTPNEVLETMRLMSKKLAEMNYKFRSNVNNDKDRLNSTAALGSSGKKAIYLPWGGFANDLITMADKEVYKWPTKEAYRVGVKYNKIFDKLKPVVRAFIARDNSLVLGRFCNSPIDFLICWTIDGAETTKELSMKTGHARNIIYLCNEFDIPVFNLANSDSLSKFKDFLQTLKTHD